MIIGFWMEIILTEGASRVKKRMRKSEDVAAWFKENGIIE